MELYHMSSEQFPTLLREKNKKAVATAGMEYSFDMMWGLAVHGGFDNLHAEVEAGGQLGGHSHEGRAEGGFIGLRRSLRELQP